MLGLTTKHRIRKNSRAWEEAMRREQTFAAIPVIAPHVQTKRDANGNLQLRFQPPPKPGIANWLARRCHLRPSVRFQLDTEGEAFWEQIDGDKSLAEIATALEKKLEVPAEHARRAAALFTYDLMCRHLIQLQSTPESSSTSLA